jgi:hypothetical protein
MRFDCYAGNVKEASIDQVAELLGFRLKAPVSTGRRRGRYEQVREVKVGGDLLGWVGHDDYLKTSYFEFKGPTSPDAAACLRAHFPDSHTVSRLDSCEDYEDPKALERLVSIVDRVRDPRVKRKVIASRDDGGSTFYWGSETSAAMVRVYEAGKMKERLHLGRPDWCRCELQLRPGKPLLKMAASQVEPLHAWGFTSWTGRLAEELSSVDVPRFVAPQIQPTYDRTTLYLSRAFRRHFQEMLSDFGSWDCVGREIESVWTADDQAEESRLNQRAERKVA